MTFLPVMLPGLCWDLLWEEVIVISGGALEPAPALVRLIFTGGVNRLITPLLRVLTILGISWLLDHLFSLHGFTHQVSL